MTDRSQPSNPDASHEAREICAVGQSIDEVAAAIGPQLDIIGRAMLGHETLRAAIDQTREERLAQTQANMNFVAGFVSAVLPVAYDKIERPGTPWQRFRRGVQVSSYPYFGQYDLRATVFKPQTFQEVNLLQAHTLWGELPLTRRPGQTERLSRGREMPAFLIGSRPLSSDSSELVLATPMRRLQPPKDDNGRETNFTLIEEQEKRGHDLDYPAQLIVATLSNRSFALLQAQITERMARYVNKADREEELPVELDEAVRAGEWPVEGIAPIRLSQRPFRFGKAIGVSACRELAVEDLIENYPLIDEFELPKYLMMLATRFGKTAELKALIAARQEK
jgi:hypothetical protein